MKHEVNSNSSTSKHTPTQKHAHAHALSTPGHEKSVQRWFGPANRGCSVLCRGGVCLAGSATVLS